MVNTNYPDYSTGEASSQPDVREYFWIILKHKWIIIIVTLGLMGVTYFFTKESLPLYQATATLQIGSGSSFQDTSSPYSLYYPQNRNINTYIAMLKSRSVLEEVIHQTRPTLPQESENKVGSYLHNIIPDLKKDIKIKPVERTNLLEISYTSPSRQTSDKVLNTLIQVFIQKNLSLERKTLSNQTQFLETQLNLVEERLRKGQDALIQFKKEKKIYSLDAEANRILSTISSFESSLQTVKIEEELSKRKLSLVKHRLKQVDQGKISSKFISSDSKVQELKTQISQKQKYLSQLKKNGSSNFRVIQLEYEVSNLENKLKAQISQLISSQVTTIRKDTLDQISEYETQLNLNKLRQDMYAQLLKSYRQKIDQLPLYETQLFELQRVVNTQDKIYTYLLEKKQEIQLTEASTTSGVQVVDPPAVFKVPTKPKRLMNTGYALLIGLFLSISSSFVIEYLDRTVKTPQDVKDKIGLPLLGEIPLIDSSRKRKRELSINDLIIHQDSTSTVAEAFRTLRTNLHYLAPEKKLKSLVISSAIPKQGKSFIVANLALTLSQMGDKTLIIDADLRKSGVEKIFEIERKPGLSDVVIGKISWKEAVKSTRYENLYLLSSGNIPPNPVELLASDKMSDILSQIEDEYEHILLDTPPVLPLTDAVVLSQKADGAILVLRYQKVEIEAVIRARERFQSVDVPILGVVLNGVEISRLHSSYYYYYRYYQDYYGKEGKKHRKKGHR